MLEHSKSDAFNLVQQLTKQVQQFADKVSQLRVTVNDKPEMMKDSAQCQSGGGLDPQCWNCGEYGHVRRNCSKRGGPDPIIVIGHLQQSLQL